LCARRTYEKNIITAVRSRPLIWTTFTTYIVAPNSWPENTFSCVTKCVRARSRIKSPSSRYPVLLIYRSSANRRNGRRADFLWYRVVMDSHISKIHYSAIIPITVERFISLGQVNEIRFSVVTMSWSGEQRGSVIETFFKNAESVTAARRTSRTRFGLSPNECVSDRKTILKWVEHFKCNGVYNA